MSDTVQIYVRGVLKLAAGALVAKAGLEATDAATLQTAVEAALGGLSALVGFYLSHRKVKAKAA